MDDDQDRARRLAEIATGRRALGHEVLAGGFRHVMMRVTCDPDRQVVVRLRPRQSEGVAVEAAVITRAADVVAVPDVLLSDPDGKHAGVPALVLSYVAGVRGDEVLRRAQASEALQIGELLGATAAALGGVGFDQPGLFVDADLHASDGGHTLSGLILPFVDRGLAEVPDDVLPAQTGAAWRTLVARTAATGEGVDGEATLVHADLNPKNVLLRHDGDRWTLAALIDWEFAMSGTALVDLGNVQRFAHHLPDGYASAVGRGFSGAGGRLRADWRPVAAALDAIALGEMLGRGPAAPLRDDVIDLIRHAVRRGTLVATDR